MTSEDGKISAVLHVTYDTTGVVKAAVLLSKLESPPPKGTGVELDRGMNDDAEKGTDDRGNSEEGRLDILGSGLDFETDKMEVEADFMVVEVVARVLSSGATEVWLDACEVLLDRRLDDETLGVLDGTLVVFSPVVGGNTMTGDTTGVTEGEGLIVSAVPPCDPNDEDAKPAPEDELINKLLVWTGVELVAVELGGVEVTCEEL